MIRFAVCKSKPSKPHFDWLLPTLWTVPLYAFLLLYQWRKKNNRNIKIRRCWMESTARTHVSTSSASSASAASIQCNGTAGSESIASISATHHILPAQTISNPNHQTIAIVVVVIMRVCLCVCVWVLCAFFASYKTYNITFFFCVALPFCGIPRFFHSGLSFQFTEQEK